MTEQWGAPLTGAQMEMLHLADGAKYGVDEGRTGEVESFYVSCGSFQQLTDVYHLPASHPAYTLLEAGWLDGRNVRLWNGGDTAPDDVDKGGRYMLRDGTDWNILGGEYWDHRGDGLDIIAYIAKDDAVDMRTERMERQRQEQAELLSNEPATVTIAKMTEAEAREWVNGNTFGLSYSDAVNCLSCLGLIKPEPTREERFWALHEPEGTTIPTHIKKWVNDALEFER